MGRSRLMIALGTLSLAAIANNAEAQGVTRVYDGANRLASETVGGQVVSYKYDGEGNLAVRCLGAACTEVIVSPDRRVLGEEGAVTRVYADGPSGTVANRSGAAAPQYPLLDSLGSVLGQASPTGTLAARRAFSAYGDVRATTDTSSVGYTGEFQDTTSKSVWLRARSYSPETGRFVERDTFEGHAETGQSLNRYAYVQNQPLSLTDPSGHDPNFRAQGSGGLSVYAVIGGGFEYIVGDGDEDMVCLSVGFGADTSVGISGATNSEPAEWSMNQTLGFNWGLGDYAGVGISQSSSWNLETGDLTGELRAGGPGFTVPLAQATTNIYGANDKEPSSGLLNPRVSRIQTDRLFGGKLDPFDDWKKAYAPKLNEARQLYVPKTSTHPSYGSRTVNTKVGAGFGNVNARKCTKVPKPWNPNKGVDEANRAHDRAWQRYLDALKAKKKRPC